MSTAATGTLTDKILEFCRILKALVREAKEHESLDETFWTPLAEFFDTDQFERLTADFSAFVSEEMCRSRGLRRQRLRRADAGLVRGTSR